MRAEVMRIQRRLGVATLYVTHDQTEAMTMGDRVAVLRAGVLQQLASPQLLYDRPANLFVASFMGSPSMNTYEASVSGPPERLVVSLGSQQLTLPAEVGRRKPALASSNGRGLIVGIRPEHLSLPPEGAAPAPGTSLQADVELVEALGNELLVHFATDAKTVREEIAQKLALDEADEADPFAGGEGISGAPVANGVARVGPRGRVAAGERLTFSVEVESLHFFDPQSGLAIEDTGA
jgi:multiple sugar transport system ATP-binding protein